MIIRKCDLCLNVVAEDFRKEYQIGECVLKDVCQDCFPVLQQAMVEALNKLSSSLVEHVAVFFKQKESIKCMTCGGAIYATDLKDVKARQN